MATSNLDGGDDGTLLNRLDVAFEGYLAALVLLVYATILITNTLMRIVTKQTFVWKQQAILGLFIWMAWLATSYTIRHRNHLRFTLVAQHLSNRVRYAIAWVEWILWIAFAGVVVRYSLPTVTTYVESGSTIPGTSIPVYLAQLSIPVGFALIVLRVLQQAVIVSRLYARGETIPIDQGIGD